MGNCDKDEVVGLQLLKLPEQYNKYGVLWKGQRISIKSQILFRYWDRWLFNMCYSIWLTATSSGVKWRRHPHLLQPRMDSILTRRAIRTIAQHRSSDIGFPSGMRVDERTQDSSSCANPRLLPTSLALFALQLQLPLFPSYYILQVTRSWMNSVFVYYNPWELCIHMCSITRLSISGQNLVTMACGQ